MKKNLAVTALALVLMGCQSKTGTMEVTQDSTRVSVSVSTPAAPPPTVTVEVDQASPSPKPVVDVEVEGNEVQVGRDGVQVQAAQGAQVKIGQEGVSIDTGQGSIQVSGVTSTRSDGDTLVIEGVGDNKTYNVENRAVEINGTGHKLKLTGSVTDLELNGTSNTVEVEKVAEVEINGTGNKVLYAGPKPKIELNGLGNECAKR